MLKKSRKRLVFLLDQEFSQLIRRQSREKYKYCPLCQLRLYPPQDITDCFHWFSRGHYATRWEIDNAIGSCASCNIAYEHDADFIKRAHEWFEHHFGAPLWDHLSNLWHHPVKYSRADLQAMLIGLEARNETEIPS